MPTKYPVKVNLCIEQEMSDKLNKEAMGEREPAIATSVLIREIIQWYFDIKEGVKK